MMSSNSSKRYASISSMAQLRVEREKLEVRITMAEERFQDHYSNFRTMFSMANLVSLVCQKVDAVQSVLQSVYAGYQFILSLIERWRGAKSEVVESQSVADTSADKIGDRPIQSADL